MLIRLYKRTATVEGKGKETEIEREKGRQIVKLICIVVGSVTRALHCN